MRNWSCAICRSRYVGLHEPRQHPITIPNNLAACRALIREQTRTLDAHVAHVESLGESVDELQQKNQTLEQEKQELKLTITDLLQRAFARRSERYLHDPNQLRIDFGDTPEATDAVESLTEAIEESGQKVREHVRRKKRKPRHENLPEHLPRYEVEAPVADSIKTCTEHGARKLIGYDQVETLEFERPVLKVRVTRYPKFACESDSQCGIGSPDRLGWSRAIATIRASPRRSSPTSTVSRERVGPELALRDFRGKLMADCYAGYQGICLRSGGAIQRAACAAHARRKVFEACEAYPRESSLVLAKFQQLYDIEDRAKTLSDEERLALRQREAQPVWAALGTWLESPAQDILPKSRFGQSLGYLRNHWQPLQLYLTDARLPIDNNDVEQLMKQVALGRKNWLFIGSLAAGDRAADFMTLVSSALRSDLDVWAYLKDILDRLLAGETAYETLRPDTWAASHPESIRQYRIQERRDQADRKQRRRAARRRTGYD